MKWFNGREIRLAVIFFSLFCSFSRAQEECLPMESLVEKFSDLEMANDNLVRNLEALETESEKILSDLEKRMVSEKLLNDIYTWRQMEIDQAAEILEGNDFYFQEDSLRGEECALSQALEEVVKSQDEAMDIMVEIGKFISSFRAELLWKDLRDIILTAELQE